MTFFWFVVCTMFYPQGWLVFLIAWLLHDCHRVADCHNIHREIVTARLEGMKK